MDKSDSSPSALFYRLNGAWLLWASLLLGFFYQTHRYPLEFGIDPPFYWRLGKYLIGAMLALFTLPKLIDSIKKFTIFEWAYLAIFLILGLQGIYLKDQFMIQGSFWPIVALLVVMSSKKIPLPYINLFFWVCWILNALFLLIEFVGLTIFNKPFVWSTDSVWTSRFGGILVEPLGAPYICLLFMGFSFQFRGFKRCLVFGISFLALLMTHTWTAFLYLILISVGMLIWHVYKYFGKLYALLLGGLLLAFSFASLTVLVSIKNQIPFLANKWTSVELHIHYWLPIEWNLFPSSNVKFSETWWVMGVQNLGLFWTFIYYWLMYVLLFDIYHAWRESNSKKGKSIYLGIFLAAGYFIFGSLNQLYPAIYPVDFLFILFALMIRYKRMGE